MSVLKKASYIEEDDRYMTPKGRLTFVALAKKFRQKDAKPDDEGAYCASIMFPPDCDLSVLEDVAKKLGLETFKDKKSGKGIDISDPAKRGKINWPFIDAEANLSDVTSKGEAVDLEGWILMRPNSYKKVVVRDSKGEVVDADDLETEAYRGRWARLILKPHAYNRPDNKGVKFYLDSVQLLGNDDSIGGGGGSKGEAFGAVDDEEDDDALG